MTGGPAGRQPGRLTQQPRESAEVSVIISTYNRDAGLRAALQSVLAQDAATTPPFELIVVDNNSTDQTRALVASMAAADQRVRSLFEPQQGISHARNSGIRAARGALLAFTDDDVRVEPNWIASMARAFHEHPEAAIVGGRVLPIWPAAPPAWLTREHWAPLALVDHGERSLVITPNNPLCLVGASMACRRSVFDAVGLFATGVQRVRNGIGSLEDHEFLLRVLASGRTGLYDPHIVVHADVQRDRLDVVYHRRWHTGHGHFHALLRSEPMERTRAGTLFGVPAHLYRQAGADLLSWMRAKARRRESRALVHQLRLCFFRGFFQTRRREFFESPRSDRRTDWWRMPRLVARRRVTRAVSPDRGAGGSR